MSLDLWQGYFLHLKNPFRLTREFDGLVPSWLAIVGCLPIVGISAKISFALVLRMALTLETGF